MKGIATDKLRQFQPIKKVLCENGAPLMKGIATSTTLRVPMSLQCENGAPLMKGIATI